jgi:hypothetical protein
VDYHVLMYSLEQEIIDFAENFVLCILPDTIFIYLSQIFGKLDSSRGESPPLNG